MSEIPEPLHYTGHLLRRAQQVHLAAWNRDVSTEITSVQFAALSVLSRHPGSSQASLGAQLDLDRSTIADLVRRLAARGLITQVRDTVDRRRNVLEITAQGAAVLSRLQPRVEAMEPLVTGGLSPSERDEFRRMLAQVLATAGDEGLLSGEGAR